VKGTNLREPEMHRRLVQRVLTGDIPRGVEFDACRAVLGSECDDQTVFHALSVLLEGALADPEYDIDDTQQLVPLLKALARGNVAARALL
jgi:hypothetical protein